MSPPITRVALVGGDYHGLRARLAVEEGQIVRRGELLFEDRANPGVRHTAPAAGTVSAIHRGYRRSLLSVIIRPSDGEVEGKPASGEMARFAAFHEADPDRLGRRDIRDLLVESGLWTAFRTRPFSRVPNPETTPAAIFVNAMDTQPLAASPEVALEECRTDYERGLRLISKLSDSATYLCVAADSRLAGEVDAPISVERFAGPHPAGTCGVHIHTLMPVGRKRTVWTVGYQDVIAVGRLFVTGHLPVERVIALGGPPVRRPRLVRSRIGASVEEHARGEIAGDDIRLISGSVLSGRAATDPALAFLGRYDLQISALVEGGHRELLGWARPGRNRFSALPVFLSRLMGRRSFDFTTDTHGARRAMVPIGAYERVMPMDILPTFLLRALVVGDLERAEDLGCLELDEEDLALCSFVCPGKIDYGPFLRMALTRLEKEA